VIGAAVGPYVIERELGRGGMGVVYAARHTGLDQRVAVKVLLPELSGDPSLLDRFFAEAKAAAASRHPGIVQILDVSRLGEAAYIVMEFLEGESLSARLARCAPLPVTEATAILRQLASALSAAHTAGVIHRDLKPDNVHVVPDPDMPLGERTKILDFGIAKIATLVGGHGALTRTGVVMGTPHYMSPEQCRGRGGVDQRSDLYAVGCIAFEMLTGQVPFPGEVGEVIGAHQYQPAPSLRTLRPDIPRALDRLVASLLAKAPSDRPASAAVVLTALDELAPRVKTGPRRAAELTPPPRPRTRTTTMGAAAGETVAPAIRRRWPRIALAAIGATALAGAVWLATRRDTSPARTDEIASVSVDARAATEVAPVVSPIAIDAPLAIPDAGVATIDADLADATAPLEVAVASPDARPQTPPTDRPRRSAPAKPAAAPTPTIDLAATIDLAEQAARRGEWQRARALAGDALTVAPSEPRALVVAALAACSRIAITDAERHVARLPPDTAARVRKACAAKGVSLPAPEINATDATAD
jgi:hypothetical protein